MKSQHNSTSAIRLQHSPLAMPRVLAIALAVTLFVIPAAQAQFSVIHNFTAGGDGATPYGGLTMDSSGNLYGTTTTGGFGGYGTVYRMNFKGSSWLLGTLYTFSNGSDGSAPTDGVIRDQTGSLYGATFSGGAYGAGAVFKLTPPAKASTTVVAPWNETTLYSFTGGSDGAFPDMLGGSLSFDASGNLYGTTLYGGNTSCDLGCGTVFKLAHSSGSWTESVLHTFAGGSGDGSAPYGGVVLDPQGNVYGATYGGGSSNCGSGGCGTLYQVVPSGSGWLENILLDFCGLYSCLDSNGPTGIALDQSGNVYSASNNAVVEMIKTSGGFCCETILNPNLCCYLVGNLIMDGSGNLYGTSVFGGAYNQGTVFKLTPSSGYWTYTSLHDFTGGSDGGQPYGALLFDGKGNLYGTASEGGTGGSCLGGCGVVFEIK
jgi:uncharacterized repeat protein (TIGR03803 family)